MTSLAAIAIRCTFSPYRFTASEEDAAQAVLALAAGKVDEQGFSAFLHANVEREKRKKRH